MVAVVELTPCVRLSQGLAGQAAAAEFRTVSEPGHGKAKPRGSQDIIRGWDAYFKMGKGKADPSPRVGLRCNGVRGSMRLAGVTTLTGTRLVAVLLGPCPAQ